jgi:hypothetical protein
MRRTFAGGRRLPLKTTLADSGAIDTAIYFDLTTRGYTGQETQIPLWGKCVPFAPLPPVYVLHNPQSEERFVVGTHPAGHTAGARPPKEV